MINVPDNLPSNTDSILRAQYALAVSAIVAHLRSHLISLNQLSMPTRAELASYVESSFGFVILYR
jgi:hypothetical protein